MKVFAIFLCILVGIAFGDPQRMEIGEDDLKANENAREANYPDTEGTTNQDQYLQSQDGHVPTQSALATRSSNETETESSEKPSSVVTPMTLTSEVKKSGQRIQLGTPATDLKLLTHSPRQTSAKKAPNEVKEGSFPRTSAADIRHTDTDSPIKTRGLFRGKRTAESIAREAKRLQFGAFAVFQNIMDIRKDLPFAVINQIYETNAAEGSLLDNLARSESIPADVLDRYRAAKSLEREVLKKQVAAAGSKASAMITSYKMLIRDSAYDDYLYDHFQLRENHKDFFDKYSAALTDYKRLKQEEFQSLDDFLQGSNQGSYEIPTRFIAKNDVNPLPQPPNTKIHSTALALKVNAEVLIVFLCILLGRAFVDLQGIETREDSLKADESATEASVLHIEETVSQDQYHTISRRARTRPIHGRRGELERTETSEKPSSVVTPMTVTSECVRSL